MKHADIKMNNMPMRLPEVEKPRRGGLFAPSTDGWLRRMGRLLSCLLALSIVLNSFAFTLDSFAWADEAQKSEVIEQHAEEQELELGLGDDEDAQEKAYIYDAGYETAFLFSKIQKKVKLPIKKMEEVEMISVLGGQDEQEPDAQADASEALYIEPVLDDDEKITDYNITALRFFQEAGLVVYTAEDMFIIRLVRPEDAEEEMEKRERDAEEEASLDLGDEEETPPEIENAAPTYEIGEGPALLSDVLAAVGLELNPTEVEMVAVLGDDNPEAGEPISVEQMEGDYLISVQRAFDAAGLALYVGENTYTLTLVNGVVPAPAEEQVEEPLPEPIEEPTEAPAEEPTEAPAEEPTEAPAEEPTETPAEAPTEAPAEAPTEAPAEEPTEAPAEEPTEAPAEEPTEAPEVELTDAPADEPTEAPTSEPTEEPAQEPTEVAYPAQTFTGHTVFVLVNVDAPEGAFPEGTTMTVKPVWNGDSIDEFTEAVSDEDVEIERCFVVDITFHDADGNEIEPLVPVAVQMTVTAQMDEGLEPLVAHKDDDGTVTLMEQTTAPENTGNRVEMNVEIAAEEPTEVVLEPTEVENEETTTVDFEADGFSEYAVLYARYTVDFHWDNYIYTIEGQDSVLLSTIFENLGVTEINAANVTNIVFSDPGLFEVTQQDGDWLIRSLASFTTDEIMTLTLANGRTVQIKVTDEELHNPRVAISAGEYDAENNTIVYTVTVEAQGDIVGEDTDYPVTVNGIATGVNSNVVLVSGLYTYAHKEDFDLGERTASQVNDSEAFTGSYDGSPLKISHMYDGDVLTLTYTASVVGGAADGANHLTVTNAASIKNENPVNNADDDNSTANSTIGYAPVVKEMLNREGNWATWWIQVNPMALRLNGGAAMTLSDTFSPNQSIDYSSITATPGVTYDYSGYIGTYAVPDAATATITYRTRIAANPGNAVVFGNTATLTDANGRKLGEAATSEHDTIYPSASDVASTTGIYMVKVFVYGDGQMQTGLSGAQLVLLDEDRRPMYDKTDELVKFTTDENGYANIQLDKASSGLSILKHTTYYLEMIKAPNGYRKDNGLYKFKITDDPDYQNDQNDQDYTYFNGDTLKIRLYQEAAGLNVSMRFSGNVPLTAEQQNRIEVILEKRKKRKTDGTWEFVESHLVSEFRYGALTFVAGSEAKPFEAGDTYRVRQENQVVWELNEQGDAQIGTPKTTYYLAVGSNESQELTGDDKTFTVDQVNEGSSFNIIINNEYEEHKLTIVKMDTQTGTRLPGAVFAAKTLGDDITTVATYTTDANGELTISGGASYNQGVIYYLEEITAPTGYLVPQDLESQRVYFYFVDTENDAQREQQIKTQLKGKTSVNLLTDYLTKTVDNQKERRTIAVMKTWQGNAWPDEVDEVVIGLYQSVNGSAPTAVLDDNDQPKQVTLDKDKPYNNQAFVDMPSRNGNGETITYTLQEKHIFKEDKTDLLEKYVHKYGISDSGVYVVYDQEAVTLVVTGEWYDGPDKVTGEHELLKQRADITFDVYRSTKPVSADIAEGGITNDEMANFVRNLEKVREDVKMERSESNTWSATISDLEKWDTKDPLDDVNSQPYYYYVLESVPSFGDETYDVTRNPNGHAVTIKNQVEPETTGLTVALAALVDDPRPESTTREFTFTLALNKGSHPIRSYKVAEGYVTDANGKVTFKLKPGKENETVAESNITFTLPVGVTATVTEKEEQEFTEEAKATPMYVTDAETEKGNVFSYEVTQTDEPVTITFTNTLHVICKVLTQTQGDKPFESFSSALAYIRIRANHDSVYINGVATIQMLEDYTMPVTDVFDVQAGETIVLATAAQDDDDFPFRPGKDADNKAIITRGGDSASLLKNAGTLTLSGVILDGAKGDGSSGFKADSDGGLIHNSGTLNLESDTILRNSATSGKGGAIYSTGTVNMPADTAITGNRAESGSAIYLDGSGELNLSGGQITGNSGASDGAVVTGSTNVKVNLSGAAVINGNTNKQNAAANLCLTQDSDNIINVVAPGIDSDAKIGVTAIERHRESEETFATADVNHQNNLNCFTNDLYGYQGKISPGTNFVCWSGLSLTIRNVFAGKGANPNDKFDITISSAAIRKDTYAIDGTMDYTVVRAKQNYPGTITLKNVPVSETNRIVINALSTGSYTVSVAASNYNNAYTGTNDEKDEALTITDGAFTLEGNSTVTVTNTRKTRTVKLTKTLVDKQLESADFDFTLALKDADGSAMSDYAFVDNDATMTTKGNGVATPTLSPSNNEPVERTLTVPVGATLTITETDNPDYRITASAVTVPEEGEGVPVTDANDSPNIFEYTVSDANIAVTFANVRKMANIVLRKELAGKVSATEKFNMTVTLTQNGSAVREGYVLCEHLAEDPEDLVNPASSITTDANGQATFTFTFNRDDDPSKSYLLSIPEGTTLVVEETEVTKPINNTDQPIYETAYAIDGADAVTGLTATINGVTEANNSIVFTNTRKLQTVTVTNKVNGYSGNTQAFTFTATVTDSNAENMADATITNNQDSTKNYDGSANDYDANGFTNGVQVFELAKGQSHVLTVPYGAKLSVAETFIVGYETKVNGVVTSPAVYQADVAGDLAVEYANDQLINLVLKNDTELDFKNIELTVGTGSTYGTKMYRVVFDSNGKPVSFVPVENFANHKVTLDVDTGETVMLEVNHDTSNVVAEQAYSVKVTTPVGDYYYTINNEPSFHEFANPAVVHGYGSKEYTLNGKLRYSVSDSTVTFSAQPLVSYDANGGAWTSEMEDYHDLDGKRQVYQYAVKKGGTAPELDEDDLIYPTNEGIKFLGWTTEKSIADAPHGPNDTINTYDFSASVNEPVYLYAVWSRPERNTHVVTVKNATESELTFTVTGGNPQNFMLVSNGTQNLTVDNNATLVITASNASALGVSAQFENANSASSIFQISKVERDGTVTFAPGVCKITDQAGKILYYGNGDQAQPAVFTTLEAALTAYDGTLYANADKTGDAPTPYAVKMLVDDYTIASKHIFPKNEMVLTTAGKGDTDGFPYVGTRDRATLYRSSTLKTTGMFALQINPSKVTLKNIIFDGQNVAMNNSGGSFIWFENSNGVLNVESGTTMRNVQYSTYTDGNKALGGAIRVENGTLNINGGLFKDLHARSGGAIYVRNSSTLSVSGSDGSTRFENCYAEGEDGGAIYSKSTTDLTIDGGNNITITTDAEGNKVATGNPGIVFTNCVAKSNVGDGGAIYVNGKDLDPAPAVSVSGCSFTECSAKNSKGGQTDGTGGGAINAYYAPSLTISNCKFIACDTNRGGGAVMSFMRNDSSETNKAVNITNCLFDHCNSMAQGGAIGAFQVSNSSSKTRLYIENSIVRNCSSGTSNGSGGAIQCYLPCIELHNTDFSDCWSGKEGGAINNFFGSVDANTWSGSFAKVYNCRFIRCRAEDRYDLSHPAHYGGAMNTKAETVEVQDSYFEACVSALKQGGALNCFGYNSNSKVTVDNCRFKDCEAKDTGGALAAATAELEVKNSSFYGCSSFAANGGAVYHGLIRFDKLTQNNTTITQNTTTITNCEFKAENNQSASCSAATNGGAVWTRAETVKVSGCEFDGCAANGNGGAVYLSKNGSSVATFDKDGNKEISITNCKATNGGAVYAEGSATFNGGEIANCQATSNGGAVYAESSATFNGGEIDSCQATSYGGAVYAKASATFSGEIKGCQAAEGSAVYTTSTATFSGANVHENTVSNKNNGAIRGGTLYFEGAVKVEDNDCSADSTCDHDVLMQNDNETTIYTTATGLSDGAHIGVYVPDIYFNKRGLESKAFGTFRSNENLERFFNDRNTDLTGYQNYTDSYIYWGGTVCKITDKDGNTLTRPNGNPAVYQRLSVAFAEFTSVTNEAGQTGTAVYVKMLVPNYELQQTDPITNFPAKNITLTTAGVDDDDHPYKGDKNTPCVISRTNSTKQLFTFNKEGKTLTLEDITLDGRKNKTAEQGDYRLIEVTNGNLVINGGTTMRYGKDGIGGAVYASTSNASTTLTINSKDGDVRFEHCTATGYGGGAINANCSVEINNNVTNPQGKVYFTDCSAQRGGAVIVRNYDGANPNAHIYVDGAVFTDCHSINKEGGALVLDNNSTEDGAYTTLMNSEFVNCHSDTNGGAVCTKALSLTVESCVFTNCSAAKNKGGALYCESSANNSKTTVTKNTEFTNCSVTRADGQGGAIFSNNKTVTLDGNTKISGCHVYANGNNTGMSGAVHMGTSGSKLNIKGNTSISGCYANQGGAIYLMSGVTMNLTGSPSFTKNGYATLGGSVRASDKGACIYLAEGSQLNIGESEKATSPVFSQNNKPPERITNGDITDYPRQDIYIAGYSQKNAASLFIQGNLALSGDNMIWVWPENAPHRLPDDQFAVLGTDAEVNAETLGKLRNALSNSDTGCSNGEYLGGVRKGNYVYWDRMHKVSFKKIDNKGVAVGGATFRLYEDKACKIEFRSATSSEEDSNKGWVNFTSIPIGYYYMKEDPLQKYLRNQKKYLVLVGTNMLSPNSDLSFTANQEVWSNQNNELLAGIENAEDKVAQNTKNVGKYYAVYELDDDYKAKLDVNLASANAGIVNIRDDFSASFKKVDGSGAPLPNAVFTVYVADGTNEDGTLKTNNEGYPSLKLFERGDESPNYTSSNGTARDADGQAVAPGVVYIPELPVGDYYLKETGYPGRNGNGRISFYVESDRVFHLNIAVNDQNEAVVTMSEWDFASKTFNALTKNTDDGYYHIANTEAVCKLTDGSGNLLYEASKDGVSYFPAIYPTVEAGFEAAQLHTLYTDKNGSALQSAAPIQLQLLKDWYITDSVTYESSHPITLTTASRTATAGDRYVFSTNRTTDTARAEVRRQHSNDGAEGALITVTNTVTNSSTLTLKNIKFNGMSSTYTGRALRVASGTLNIDKNTLIQDFKQTEAEQLGSVRGGAILMDDRTTLNINGGTSRTAIFTDNKVINDNGNAEGGAIALGANCTVTITDAQFKNASASASGVAQGGAISAGNNTLPLTRAVFVGNVAEIGGAICVGESGNLTFDSGSISGGASDDDDESATVNANFGSAIYAGKYATVSIRDGSITGNTAAIGGAVEFDVPADSDTDKPVLNLSGATKITDNKSMVMVDEQIVKIDKNVVLNMDSNELIQVDSPLKKGASIGVYVEDMDDDGALVSKHALRERPFATYLMNDANKHPDAFKNDRFPKLTGVANTDDGTFNWNGSLTLRVVELEQHQKLVKDGKTAAEVYDDEQKIKKGKATFELQSKINGNWVTIWSGANDEDGLVRIPWKDGTEAANFGGANFSIGSEYILRQTQTDSDHTKPNSTWTVTVGTDNSITFTPTEENDSTTLPLELVSAADDADLLYNLYNAKVQAYRVKKRWVDAEKKTVPVGDDRLKDLDVTIQLYRVSSSSGIDYGIEKSDPPVQTKLTEAQIEQYFPEFKYILQPKYDDQGNEIPDDRLWINLKAPEGTQVGFMPLTVNGATVWYIVPDRASNTRYQFLRINQQNISGYANNAEFIAFSGRILKEGVHFKKYNNNAQLNITDTEHFGTTFKRGDIVVCDNKMWVYRNDGETVPNTPSSSGNLWYYLGGVPEGGTSTGTPTIAYSTQEGAVREQSIQLDAGFSVGTVDNATTTEGPVTGSSYTLRGTDEFEWQYAFTGLEGGQNVYYYALETAVLGQSVMDTSTEWTKSFEIAYDYHQTGEDADTVTITNRIPDYVARVSNDDGKNWTYFTKLVNDDANAEGIYRGAFNFANGLNGDVIVELLKEDSVEYHLASEFEFNGNGITSLTIRTTPDTDLLPLNNEQKVRSKLTAIGTDGGSLIKTTVNTNIADLIFQGGQDTDSQDFNMRALHMAGQGKNLDVVNTAFSGLKSNENGGALYLESGNASFGGTVSTCSAANGGAIYAASGTELQLANNAEEEDDIVYATISGNTATTAGAGIYLAEGSRLNLFGKPSFGEGGGTNTLTDELDGQTNGNQTYTQACQDIYIAGKGNDDGALDSLCVTGALEAEAGSIWVWPDANDHIREGDQFALFSETLFDEVTGDIKLTDAALDVTLRAFRDARPDADTLCQGDYLYGMRSVNTGEESYIVWGTAGVQVTFNKVDGNGDPVQNAVFTLYRAYQFTPEDADAKKPSSQTLGEPANIVSKASNSGADGDNVIFSSLIPAGVYYMLETVPNGDFVKTTAEDTQVFVQPAATEEGETPDPEPQAGVNPTVYVLLVGASALTEPKAEDKADTLWASGKVLQNITQQNITDQQADGPDNPWKQYAIFRIDPATGQAVAEPDIAGHGIMNVSTKSRKVILRKVLDTYMAKKDVEFTLYAIDGSVIENNIKSKSSGVSYIGTLPYGKYCLAEADATTGKPMENGQYFRFGVSSLGVFEWEDENKEAAKYTNQMGLSSGHPINEQRQGPTEPEKPERDWVWSVNPAGDAAQNTRDTVFTFTLKDTKSGIEVSNPSNFRIAPTDAYETVNGGIKLKQYGETAVTLTLKNAQSVVGLTKEDNGEQHTFTLSIPRPEAQWTYDIEAPTGGYHVGGVVQDIVFTETNTDFNGNPIEIRYSANPACFTLEAQPEDAIQENNGVITLKKSGDVTITATLNNASAQGAQGLTADDVADGKANASKTITVQPRAWTYSLASSYTVGNEISDIVFSTGGTDIKYSEHTNAFTITPTDNYEITTDGKIKLTKAGTLTVTLDLTKLTGYSFYNGETNPSASTTVDDAPSNEWTLTASPDGPYTVGQQIQLTLTAPDGRSISTSNSDALSVTFDKNSYAENWGQQGIALLNATDDDGITITATFIGGGWGISGFTSEDNGAYGSITIKINPKGNDNTGGGQGGESGGEQGQSAASNLRVDGAAWDNGKKCNYLLDFTNHSSSNVASVTARIRVKSGTVTSVGGNVSGSVDGNIITVVFNYYGNGLAANQTYTGIYMHVEGTEAFELELE